MNPATRPVRRTRHLDEGVPGYILHRSFRHPAAAARNDPAAVLAEPPPAAGHMPDEVSRDHSKRMHYAAHRMHRAKTRRDLRKWQRAYVQLRNSIVVGNRKLIFRAVQAFAKGSQQAEDLAGDCHVILIHAVVAFNPWMGIRFSTYAYTCLLRALSRLGKRAAKDVNGKAVSLGQFVEGDPPRPAESTPAHNQYRLDDYFRADHPLLSDREKKVISRRFNLAGQAESLTLEQVGKELGLSKERVRQVQADAITKLKQALTLCH